MTHRAIAFAVAAALLATNLPLPARADNAMGYRLLSPQEAASLPRNGGGLGLDVGRAQQITDGGMTFDIIGIRQVRNGSPGAQAGLKPGDQIIAVNGRVFPDLRAFAAYVGSMPPGTQASVDYIPAGDGPNGAQRIGVSIAPRPGQPSPPAPAGGLSTGTKVAIGAGAVALLGCYEMGCFSRHKAATPLGQPQQYPGQAGQASPYGAQPGMTPQ